MFKKLEAQRKVCLILSIFGWSFGAVFLLGIFAEIINCILIGIIAIPFLLISYYFKKNHKKNFKKIIINENLKRIFAQIEYQPDKGFPKEMFEDIDMIKMGNIYSSEDYIKATYNGVNFEQADVCIMNRGRKITITYFQGRWIIFEFNKIFNGRIQIKEKDFYSATNTGGLFSDSPKMEKVKMEDIEFNEKFDVFSSDGQEAYYIMTPQMINRIKTLKEKINNPIVLCFVDNKLHVGIDSRTDSFEPPIIDKIDLVYIYKTTYEETREITNFIDDLRLDQNIFKLKEED